MNKNLLWVGIAIVAFFMLRKCGTMGAPCPEKTLNITPGSSSTSDYFV